MRPRRRQLHLLNGYVTIISMTDLKDLWEGRLAPAVKDRLERGEKTVAQLEQDVPVDPKNPEEAEK